MFILTFIRCRRCNRHNSGTTTFIFVHRPNCLGTTKPGTIGTILSIRQIPEPFKKKEKPWKCSISKAFLAEMEGFPLAGINFESNANKKSRLTTGFLIWRRWRDSNPRTVARQLISSQPRYDHFDTSPYEFYAGSGAGHMISCQVRSDCRRAALRTPGH